MAAAFEYIPLFFDGFIATLVKNGTVHTTLTESPYIDNEVQIGQTYTYMIKTVKDGVEYLSEHVTVSFVNDTDDVVVYNTELYRNYPNPFNPETTIQYSVKETDHISIEIYNIKGQKVKTLVNSVHEQGKYSLVWNGTDSHSKNSSSGIYFCVMKGNEYRSVRKMVLLK